MLGFCRVDGTADQEPDDMVDLNYWSNAESTVTIIAASIPVLRVLMNDVTTSISNKRSYFRSEGATMDATKKSRLQNANSFHTLVSARRPKSPHSLSSDAKGIVQTSHVGIEYSDRKEDEYPMHNLPV